MLLQRFSLLYTTCASKSPRALWAIHTWQHENYSARQAYKQHKIALPISDQHLLASVLKYGGACSRLRQHREAAEGNRPPHPWRQTLQCCCGGMPDAAGA